MTAPTNETVLRHEQVAAALREEVLQRYQPGDRLPPDTASAERFGVSVVTLRDAMRLLVKEGLLRRRRGSGTYVLDRTEAARGRVAIVCSEGQRASGDSSYWRLLLQALQRRLKSEKLVPEVHFEVDEELDASAILRETPEAPLSGVIVVNRVVDSGAARQLCGHGVPVLTTSRGLPGAFKVDNDVAGMVREAVRYLVEHGRQRLALITLRKRDSSHPGVDDWMEESFLAALAQHDVPFVAEWVCGISHADGPGAAFDAVHRLWRALPTPPDGLLVTDDTIFPEVAMAILEMNVAVPDTLLVATHANLGTGMFSPFPVVRFAFDPDRLAAAMCDKLKLMMLGGKPSPPFAILPFHLIEPLEAYR